MLKKQKLFKLILALCLMLTLLLSIASCKPKKDNEVPNSPGNNLIGEDVPSNTAGLIFNSKTTLNVICLDSEFPAELANEFAWAIKENLKTRASIITHKVDDVPKEHEIIFGKSDRSVSKTAYERLDAMMGRYGDESGGYVLYSDGKSLALAFTVELGTQHLDEIMAELCEMAGQVSLVEEKGVVSSKVYDMYEIYKAEDEARSATAWAALEKKVGAETTLALRELYSSLYTNDMVSWLANLYEPRTCICDNYVNGVRVCLHPTDDDGNYICSNGGFYYSNSARNTYGFLPDIESTYQALTFMEMTGMLSQYGGSFGAFIDGQMKADILAFTKGLQNEDGYFYHPQWTIETSKSNWARVSRDLMWAEAILKKFDERPYYNTPTGMSGTKTVASSSHLTERLSADSVSAVSKVRPTAAFADHLQSAEAFKTYLSKFKMDVYGAGYTAANELAAQVNQLTAANKALGGALEPILFEFFEEKHNPDNGLWRAETDYDGLNTVFKAVMVYSSFGRAFTYADKAVESAIYVLSSDEVPGHVCGVYNTWYDISGLISNIRKYHSSDDRGAVADALLEKVRKIAPSAIRKSIENTERFRKTDKANLGSFSYFADHCSETSQGMVVALRKNEGDINATLICSGGLIDHIGAALGVALPDIFGTRELAEFMDIINYNTYSTKDSLPPDVYADFEGETVGIESADVKKSMSSGGSCLVDLDPYDENNQVLHMQSLAKSGTWDAITIPNNTFKVDANCLVFDGKFMFAKEGTSQGYLVQFYLGNMGKASPYFINFTVAGDYVQVWEGSSDNNTTSFDRLLGKFKLDKWFRLRIEYYFGYEDVVEGLTPHDTVRIKIYTNDTLVAVSANYMDTSTGKFINGTGTPTDEASQALFFVMSYFECNAYFDDLYLGYKKIEYKNEKDTEGLIVNEDARNDREAYGFEENTVPEEITITDSSSKFTVEDEAIKFNSVSGNSTIKITANTRASLANVYAVGFDVKLEGVTEGNIFTINIKDPYRGITIVTYTMKCAKIDGELALVPVYKGATLIPSVAVFADGETYHLEFAFFVDSATTLIYKNGEMLASTEQGVMAKHYFYEMGYAEIVYSGKATLTLDNIYCEKRSGDFDEEVKPKVDRIEVDFANGGVSDFDNITTNGTVKDGMLNIAGKYVTVNANNRSPYVSTYQFFTNLKSIGYSEGTVEIRYLDANDKTVIGLVMTLKNGIMYIYEMQNDQKVGEYVGNFIYNGECALTLNFHVNEGVLELYADGEIVLVTGQLNGTDAGAVTKLKMNSTIASVNNFYLDGITLTYTAPKVDKATGDDNSETITYDYSSLGNYPDRVTTGSGITESSTIEYVERDGELTKALVYKKSLANYGNGIRFNFGDGASHPDVVFETDIKLAGGFIAGDWKSNFDILFSSSSGGTHMFYVQFRVSGGHLWVNLYDGKTQLTKYDCGAITKDDWVNIRAEVKTGDRSSNEVTGARIVIYVNDIEVYNGNDFHGSYATDAKTAIGGVYQVIILPLQNVTGTLYIDNTTIKEQ